MKTLQLTCLAALLFLFSSSLQAQVAVGNTGEIVAQNQTTLSLSFTVPVGTNRLLLVSTGTDLTGLTATYDGTPMTLQGVTPGSADLWTMTLGTDLVSPTTADIVFTISGATAAQFIGINAISFTGVDQTTPVDNVTTQAIAGGETSSMITIPSKANDMVFEGVGISCLGCFAAPLAAPALGTTSLQNEISFVGFGFAGAGKTGTTPGVAPSVSPSWAFSGSSIFAGTHNGLNVRSAMALPVALTTFTARPKNEDVLLNWKTQSEWNNAGFVVQRSSDGLHFKNIATLPGHGTSKTAQQYQYIDLAPPAGRWYYRLKQMDHDGRFEYSEVVNLDLQPQASFSVFPNPASSELTIQAQVSGTATVTLLDETGRRIKHFELAEGQATIDIADLPNGIYTLTIMHQDQLFVEKLVKFD